MYHFLGVLILPVVILPIDIYHTIIIRIHHQQKQIINLMLHSFRRKAILLLLTVIQQMLLRINHSSTNLLILLHSLAPLILVFSLVLTMMIMIILPFALALPSFFDLLEVVIIPFFRKSSRRRYRVIFFSPLYSILFYS